MVLSNIARVLGAVATVYMVLCFLRVLSTWLPAADLGRAGVVLRKATDPYLRLFSRIPFLRSGGFDFSPIAALAVLTVLNSALMTLASTGIITLGLVLGLLLAAFWSAIGFVISFFAVIILVRIIVAAAHWNSLHPLWMLVDSMLNPLLFRINRLFYRNRIVHYLQSLVTGFVVLILVRVAGGSLVGLIVGLLDRLPF